MSRKKYFMSRQDFIEWGCDRVCYVATQSARNRRLLVAIECFYVTIEFVQARSFLVTTKYFMLRQSVAKGRGFVLR